MVTLKECLFSFPNSGLTNEIKRKYVHEYSLQYQSVQSEGGGECQNVEEVIIGSQRPLSLMY